jgi:hypothetical protein
VTPERGRALSILVLVGAVLAVALAGVLGGLQRESARRPLPDPGTTPLPAPAMAPPGEGVVRVLAAGDIGLCGSLGAMATGALLDVEPDATVLALGDLAYERGTTEDFARCYDPAWGDARERTIPVAGNHDHETPGAAPLHEYFGAAAGEPGAPWRSVAIGAWRVVLLDSECDRVGGCGEGSAQLAWLREELARSSPETCLMAVWHRARWSSGPHGADPRTDPFWRELAAAGADIVLAAHDHTYERFAPMDASGARADGGIRSWVVGTGGGQLYRLGERPETSEAAWDQAHGVLELLLRPDGYDWRFLAAIGEPFEDTGSGTC